MQDELRDSVPMQEARFNAFERSLEKGPMQELLRAYKAAYKETVAQMASLYEKVGQADGTIRKEDAIRYRQLDNRLANIAAEMETLRKKGVRLTEETSTQAVQDAYYGNQWALEQSVGAPIPVPALPVAAIRAAVLSDFSGLDYIKTWEKNSTKDVFAIRSTITRGITQGYSYPKMAREIKALFNGGMYDAMRVIRTEAGRCWSEGAEAMHEAALEAGVIVKKRWSAALDMRTRSAHAKLDGQYADDEGYFNAGGERAKQPRTFGIAALDINCRCASYDVIEGYEPTMRRIRDDYTDPKSGSSIVPYQTFAQWAGPRGWTEDKGWPKK